MGTGTGRPSGYSSPAPHYKITFLCKGNSWMPSYIADQSIMNNWNYLLEYKKKVFDKILLYRRTKNSFCQNIIYENKSISSIYVFGLKKDKNNNILGHVGRVYIKDEFRKLLFLSFFNPKT